MGVSLIKDNVIFKFPELTQTKLGCEELSSHECYSFTVNDGTIISGYIYKSLPICKENTIPEYNLTISPVFDTEKGTIDFSGETKILASSVTDVLHVHPIIAIDKNKKTTDKDDERAFSFGINGRLKKISPDDIVKVILYNKGRKRNIYIYGQIKDVTDDAILLTKYTFISGLLTKTTTRVRLTDIANIVFTEIILPESKEN